MLKNADLPFFSVENRILGQGRVPKNNRYINQSSDSEPSNFKRLIWILNKRINIKIQSNAKRQSEKIINNVSDNSISSLGITL